jgi:zinc protease
VLGYHTPSPKHEDYAALYLTQYLLTHGNSALLQKIWVNAGLATDIGGGLDQFQDPGLLSINAELPLKGDPEKLLSVLDQGLKEQVLARDLTSDLKRAKNQLLLSIYQQLEDNDSLANYLGEFITAAGDPAFAFELINRIAAVTPEKVKQVVSQYLVPQNRTVIVGEPEASRKDRK